MRDSTSIPHPIFDANKIWGRTGAGRSWLGSLGASSLVFLAPVGTIVVYIVLTVFKGSFASFVASVAEEGFDVILAKYSPRPTFEATFAIVAWVGLQAFLFEYLPGKIGNGQYTPAGHVLTYRLNGLSAWVVTHAVWGALCWVGLLDPAFIARNWSGLIATMNLAGVLVAGLAFAKAYIHPTHPRDRKFSGTLNSREDAHHQLTISSVSQDPRYMTTIWGSN
jgi:7-dehydrocholesterol reductase